MRQWIAVVVCLACVACSSSDDPAPIPGASEDVGAAGGTVAVTTGPLAGAKVVVPAGALADTVAISINAGSDVPSGVTVSAGPAVKLGPDGTMFTTPVTVTIPFTGPAGDVEVWYRNDMTGVVSQINGLTIDATAKTVSFNISTFSTVQSRRAPGGATFDANGTWIVMLSNFMADNGDKDPDFAALAEITQEGTAITFTVPDAGNVTFSGTVNGAVYTVTRSGEGETETIEFTLTSDSAGTGMLTSTDEQDGNQSATLTLSRPVAPMFMLNGDRLVTLSNNFSDPSGSEDNDGPMVVPFTQNGNAFTIEVEQGQVETGIVSGANYY
ncbi:MAG: hypothetical protein ACYTF9_14405, partial [Planctomycetota bacterium]